MPSTFAPTSRRSQSDTSYRADVYARVTDQIVQAIEEGAGDWKMPWHTTGAASVFPFNAITGNRYRGVNTVSLWAMAQKHSYPEAKWATYRQWAELGHQVRKGERSTYCVFWKMIELQDNESEGRDDPDLENNHRWIARAFCVFNVAQTENYQAPALPPQLGHERIDHAEAFAAALGADIRHGGNRAFYRPTDDFVQMPPFEAFVNPEAYYSTLAHELTHWTGHESRLNRDLKNRFGDAKYAAEELIAELGAAFISADLGLALEPKAENAAYVQTWLKVLKSDKRAIFAASSHAQAAADYLHNLQPLFVVQPEAHRGQQLLCL